MYQSPELEGQPSVAGQVLATISYMLMHFAPLIFYAASLFARFARTRSLRVQSSRLKNFVVLQPGPDVLHSQSLTYGRLLSPVRHFRPVRQ